MEILRITCSGDSVRNLIRYVIELHAEEEIDSRDFLFDDLTPQETSFILNETTSLIETYIRASAVHKRPIKVIEDFIADINLLLNQVHLNCNNWVKVEVVSLAGEVDIAIQEVDNPIGVRGGEFIYGK